MKKLLICKWDAMTYPFIIKTFSQKGYEQEVLVYPIDRMRRPETRGIFMELLKTKIKEDNYIAVFSVNFISAIAEVCHDMQILYISWSYDSPSIGEEPRTHYYDTNRIFVFDSAEYETVKQEGVENIWQVDLAVDCNRFDEIKKTTPKERIRFQSDISFVGQLYCTDYQNMLPHLSEYSAGMINAIRNTQLLYYGKNIVKDVVNWDLIHYIYTPEFEQAMKPYAEKLHVYGEILRPDVMRVFLLQSVANKERVMLLSMLSKYYKTAIFCRESKQEHLENVSFRGIVDYWNEMPLVFKNSKINLNSTLRTIEKGIPQRCLDILACKGLLLTNRQEDMAGKLVENQDMVVYESIGDAVEKAGFYLKHEDIAEKIRINGYNKVKKEFSFRTKLDTIMKLSGVE